MNEQSRPERADGQLILPVNLLIEKRPCLVVGGGPVAYRKTTGLLTAGATVRVVSPGLCTDMEALVMSGQVTHVSRCFAPADAGGMCIVFAATDDREVNRQVLNAARAAGALCCCVDGNWTDGDFVTPATLHMDGLSVSVSTGGRSCRQARMVKDTLRRHLRSIETADLLILGTSHAELVLERREAVQLAGAKLQETGCMLMQVWGIHEFMLLITCNRVELVAIASVSAGQSGLLERILGFDGLDPKEWYRLTGAEAFEHMALVTAGMHSQSPGEYHVASQVKKALRMAAGNGWANGMLQAWIAAALHISKHIKNEVTPLLPPCEIANVPVDYITELQGDDWRGRTVLVLGSGMLGRSLVGNVLAQHGRCVWCYHSNRPVMAADWDDRVRVLPWDERHMVLGACDAVFCAAEAPGYVLDTADASRFDPARPVLIVDLGVPRNVNPELMPLLPAAELVNMDRLKAWSVRRQGHLDEAMAMSRLFVEQHREDYATLIARFQGRNPIQ